MKKWSKLLVALLVLSMMAWTLAGCGGGSGSGEEETKAPESTEKTEQKAEGYTASEVTSDLSMADSVKAFYDKVDMKYAYDLTYELAYNDDELVDNKLGWRSAGSDAEHRTADYLQKEMEKIGLQNVDKIGTKCDKFQFNDSSLTIEGTDIDLMPASYQCNGTGKEGIQAEIVDVGTGLEADYEGKDVKGKIVLADVDQKDVSWIDGYIRQAHEKGAAALVTYATKGYGLANKDTANVQDICCSDLIPTCAISVNDAEKIKAAIGEKNNKANLMLDAVLEDDGGTTYNVVGMIPGENHDQRVIIAGHYDKYWYGFQDDCAAIGLVYGIAKAMVDSEYKPKNDIVFIAHGGEEWGVTGSQFDWTVGAWGMIEENEDWQGTTLALINCELPAFKTESGQTGIGAVPEFRTLANKLVNETGLVVTAGDCAMATEAFDTTTMEDGVSYRWHGVPYFINMFEDEAFMYNNYHTNTDNKDTYDEATFQTNINWYAAMAMYIDNEPALEMDFTQVSGDLKKNLNEEVAKEAGIDTESYLAAVDELEKAGAARNEKIDQINSDYEKAVKDGDEEAAAKLREEGVQLNKNSLEAFRDVQDDFLKDNDFQIFYGHQSMNENIEFLNGAIAGLEKKELWAEDEASGALDNAWQLNAFHDYNYCIFSKEIGDQVNELYSPDYVTENDYWGWKKQVPIVEVGEATYELNQKSEDENPDIDWEAMKKIYQDAKTKHLGEIKTYGDQEITDMKAIAEKLAEAGGQDEQEGQTEETSGATEESSEATEAAE